MVVQVAPAQRSLGRSSTSLQETHGAERGVDGRQEGWDGEPAFSAMGLALWESPFTSLGHT